MVKNLCGAIVVLLAGCGKAVLLVVLDKMLFSVMVLHKVVFCVVVLHKVDFCVVVLCWLVPLVVGCSVSRVHWSSLCSVLYWGNAGCLHTSTWFTRYSHRKVICKIHMLHNASIVSGSPQSHSGSRPTGIPGTLPLCRDSAGLGHWAGRSPSQTTARRQAIVKGQMIQLRYPIPYPVLAMVGSVYLYELSSGEPCPVAVVTVV